LHGTPLALCLYARLQIVWIGVKSARFKLAKRVIVMGGGIIGASFAYHLAKAGAEVKLLDAGPQPGGVATPMSFAWINASWGNPEFYFHLRHHAMKLWRQLDKEIAGLSVNWSGSLLWDLGGDALSDYVKQQRGWGYDVVMVNAKQIARREPQLSHVPEAAAFAKDEGSVEPVQAVQCLLQGAKAWGADVLQGVRIKRLVEERGRIIGVMTDDGVLDADCVVLAAGAATNDVLSPFGRTLDIYTPPGLLVHTEPVGEMLKGLAIAPGLHVRQTVEGRLVAGTDFGGADPGADPDVATTELMNRLKDFFKGGEAFKLSHATVGYRPTPRDDVSAVGVFPGLAGLYVCLTHSGITLAPALGALGAREIMHEERDDLLSGFAPDRLLETA
jgi:glycine/D-amino acid oxidase-like deaminating enzyme